MTQPNRRRFLEHSLAAAAAAASLPLLTSELQAAPPRKVGPNDRLRVAVLGVRSRGLTHVDAFTRSPDTEVVAICDPDSGVVAKALKRAPKARLISDLREVFADESIDIVSIATPNHWHALATIWALQAGKHVYVEKPISHTIHEGRAIIEAAAKSGRVVQHGTQSRSTRAHREAIAWMQKGGLGKVKLARGLCYKRRKSIGEVREAQKPPVTLDYDLWCGPAPKGPLLRKNLHYDWHWDFATGAGDLGNQGVHQMDIARWGLGLQTLPKRVTSFGGRFGYVDDGNTPNTEVALLEWDDATILFEVRGLETRGRQGVGIGVLFQGEGGTLVSTSRYHKIVALDRKGNVMKTFKGGGNHFQDFIDAVKKNDAKAVQASPLDGHLSSALCHAGNISYRLGAKAMLGSRKDPFPGSDLANACFAETRDHLASNGLSLDGTLAHFGPTLSFSSGEERFAGEHAQRANALIRRAYRAPFVVR